MTRDCQFFMFRGHGVHETFVHLTHDVEHHVGRHEAVGRGEDGESQGAADREHAQEENGAVELRQTD